MKKITLLLLLAFTTTLAFAEDVAITETYTRVVQTSASGANTLWPGDHFVWTNYRFRRGTSDLFSDTQTQAGWFGSLGYFYSREAVEGGIKTLSIDWAQFGAEANRTLRLMINIDGVNVDSILRDGNLGACPKQVYTNTAINSKKNAVLRLNNTSYEQATGAPCAIDYGRFLIGNITWTPYLWYSNKKAAIEVGQTYTNTSLINNLDGDMDAPAFTSSNPLVATVNHVSGEVTALSEGSVTIAATSGDIAVTYTLKVAEDALTETYANVVQTSASAAGTKWNGNYFEWTVGNIRRAIGDVFPDSRDQGGWFSTSNTNNGLVESTNPIEGGIKALTFPWAQFGNESTKTLKMVIKVDGVRVDSIVRENTTSSAYGTETTYTNNAINCKKNATLGLYNLSYTKTNPTNLEGRFVLGNITWTPYLWYLTKTVTIYKGSKFTNTDMIDNLDNDMDDPTYSSSNTTVATVDPTTGEVTGVNTGTTTITATTGLISTTYELTVDITSGTRNNNINDFVVYPTYISDVLNIRTTEKDFNVRVYNQLGNLVATYNNINNIPFNHFAAGMYIIRIQSENKVDTIHKVLKR